MCIVKCFIRIIRIILKAYKKTPSGQLDVIKRSAVAALYRRRHRSEQIESNYRHAGYKPAALPLRYVPANQPPGCNTWRSSLREGVGFRPYEPSASLLL